MTLSRKIIWGVSKDTRSSDSSRKAFVRKVREIGVAANGQSPYRWLEKMLTLEGKLLVESVLRGRIDFSYLPVVGTKTTCLFEGLYITET